MGDNEFDYKKHSVKDLAQHFASQQQIFTKKEVSNEDIEASKKAYELKKKQRMEQKQQQAEQQPDFKLSGDEVEEDGGGEGRAEREETSLHLVGTVDGPRGRARRGRPY